MTRDSDPLSAKGEETQPLSMRRLAKVGIALSAAFVIAGCTVKSEPLTTDEIGARIAADQDALFEGQEAITGPLGLGEAIVRSIQYNLDSRVKFMELAVAMRQLDFSEKGMLPDLVAQQLRLT